MLDQYKLILLDCFYRETEDEKARQALIDTAALKIEGYFNEFQKNVLPVDTSDFYATHFIICERKKNIWKPVMASKATTLSRTEEFQQPFPVLSLLEGKVDQACIRDAKEKIETAKKRKLDISYDSSWTIDYRIRKDSPEKAFLLLEVFTSVMVNYHRDPKIEIPAFFVAGVPKVKTDTFFEKLGARPLKGNAHFPHAGLLGEDVVMMYCDEFSRTALRCADRWLNLWESREVLSAEAKKVVKAAA